MMSELLLEWTIRASIIFAVVLLAGVAIIRSSAAIRHSLYAAAMLSAVLLPLIASVVPAWRVVVQAGPTAEAVEPQTAAAESGAATVVAVLDEESQPRFSMGEIAVLLWAAGLSASLFALVGGAARLRRVSGKAQAVTDPRWTAMLSDAATALRLRRPIRLIQASQTSMLMTWGMRKPRLLIPADALDWPDERVRVVLLHELAHIRRQDWIVQIIAGLCRAAFWFNPLAWRVHLRLLHSSERACDDVVLQSGCDAHAYASHLLELARTFKSPPAQTAPAVAMTGRFNLERRIVAMLNPNLNRCALTSRAALSVALLTLCFVIPLAAFQLETVNVRGTVYDATGAVIPGVALTLMNSEGDRITRLSNRTGSFTFADVTPGQYELKGELPGFQTFHSESFAVQANQVLERDVTLTLGAIQTRLVVDPASSLAPEPRVEAPSRRDATVASGQRGGPVNSLVRIGGNVGSPRLLRQVLPVYPQSAIAVGAEGAIVLEAVIQKDGRVSVQRVLRGSLQPPDQNAQIGLDFSTAATEAVSQWLFEPTLLNGVSVDAAMTIEVEFRLPR